MQEVVGSRFIFFVKTFDKFCRIRLEKDSITMEKCSCFSLVIMKFR